MGTQRADVRRLSTQPNKKTTVTAKSKLVLLGNQENVYNRFEFARTFKK